MMKNENDDVVSNLKTIIKKLNEEIIRLTDENESLWNMLEEMTASDIKNWSDVLQKEYEKIKFDKLMITKKMGDA